MFKSSFKAFARGLSYHAGAGVGEALRAVLTTASLAGMAYGATIINDAAKKAKLKRDIMGFFDNLKK